MGSQGYVLDAARLSAACGRDDVTHLLAQADEHERDSRVAVLPNMEATVRSWCLPSADSAAASTDGEPPQPAGKHLLAIIAASAQNRRARATQVRGVSDPRTLSHLLQDLHLGRAVVVVPSPVNPDEIAAWAIVDMNPGKAPENHARVVHHLMDNFPHFHTTPGGPPQVAGHLRLRFQGETEGPEARPKVAFVVQILRLREISGWEAPGGMPLGDWLRDALWETMVPYLIERGIHLLVGEKLVSLDGTPVVPVGAAKPGEVKDGWSFYDTHFFDVGLWAHETFSSTAGMIGALQAAFPPAGDEKRTDLTYSVMIAPLGDVELDMQVGRAPIITRKPRGAAPAAEDPVAAATA